MMIEDKSPGTPRWVRKLLIPGLVGGVVGYAAAATMMYFIDSSAVGGLGMSATIASLVGVVYAVIGLSVGFGAASPGIGARFLNVEDADELREQKKVLTLSGAAMALWGASLLALALAAPDGPVPQGAALAVGFGGLAIGTWLSLPAYRASDELMRAISLEAGALGYGLVLLVVGIWAMLAHLGYTAAPAPLDLLSLFYVLVLVASFIIIGRRGMLAPR
jgi:hypothetical protein